MPAATLARRPLLTAGRAWGRVVLAGAIVGIVVAASVVATVEPRAFSLRRHIPLGDKLGHFFAFGLATWAVLVAVSPRPRPEALAIGAMIAFVVVEELVQLAFATRSFSLIDLSASFAGVATFAFLVRRRRRPRRRSGGDR